MAIKMIKQFILYNFQYFHKKRKEPEGYSWFLAVGFTSMGFAFNAATILFLYFGNYRSDLKFENPGYLLVGLPWLVIFLIIFFNRPFKQLILQESYQPMDQKWRLIFWVYYLVTVIVYSFALSFFSRSVY